jgi:hypothetical protein
LNQYIDPEKRTKFVDEGILLDMIVEYATNGKKIFVGCDTKANTEYLKELLISKTVPE